MQDNVGYHPEGPKCLYNGKVVHCLTFGSESGGITGKILVQMLEHFDSINLFLRVPRGPIPMIVLDGHQSRLDPMFVSYINNEDHRWGVCLGVPYATVLWQVGDASEQNGRFKMEWYREKERLMAWKGDHTVPEVISPTDIIPLLNRVFHKSYDNIASNLKAVADRGWYPANRKLLEHKDLLNDTTVSPTEGLATPTATFETQQDSSAAASSTAIGTQPDSSVAASSTDDDGMITLNLGSGMGETCINRIIHARMRNVKSREAADKRRQRGSDAMTNMKEAKRLSSGSWWRMASTH